MATKEQIADWKAAGREVRQRRETREDYPDRPADEVKRLREEAAESAARCADCFTPLTPQQSVTLVTRAVEHVEGRYFIGIRVPEHDRRAAMPICLTCWLTEIAAPPSWLAGFRHRNPRAHAIDHPEPVRPFDHVVQRLRCEGCGRLMRVTTKSGGRLPARARCCCAACLRTATRRRNNERRRVRHQPMRCVVCRAEFVPTQSTAKTCSNKCRQALHRRRHS
jgi:hypothetical protein